MAGGDIAESLSKALLLRMYKDMTNKAPNMLSTQRGRSHSAANIILRHFQLGYFQCKVYVILG